MHPEDVIEVAGITHVGRVRQKNEDSIFFNSLSDSARLLAVVADGMGGHAGGSVASQLAVNEFSMQWEKKKAGCVSDDWLVNTALHANLSIRSRADEDISLRGMGTTLVALLIADGLASVINIGVSRCYHLRKGVMRQVTRDHSVVQQLIDDGAITKEDAENSPVRNYLTRSLGSHEHPIIDAFFVRVLKGDRFLLCSDGLTNMLMEKNISERLLSGETESDVCISLLDGALAVGAKDNVSVIVCTV